MSSSLLNLVFNIMLSRYFRMRQPPHRPLMVTMTRIKRRGRFQYLIPGEEISQSVSMLASSPWVICGCIFFSILDKLYLVSGSERGQRKTLPKTAKNPVVYVNPFNKPNKV